MLAHIIATPSVGFQGGVRGGIRHQEHLNLNILTKFQGVAPNGNARALQHFLTALFLLSTCYRSSVQRLSGCDCMCRGTTALARVEQLSIVSAHAIFSGWNRGVGSNRKIKYSGVRNRTGVPQVLRHAANELGWPKKTPDELKNYMIA